MGNDDKENTQANIANDKKVSFDFYLLISFSAGKS